MFRTLRLIAALLLVLSVSGLTTPSPATAKSSKVVICHANQEGDFKAISVSEHAKDKHIANHGDGIPGEPVPGQDGAYFDANCGVFEAASCAEIRANNPTATDGPYSIITEQTFTVHCHDMAGDPREYLTLLQTENANFSQYTAGGARPGTSVRTSFTKVRIDPSTLRIDIADRTFSSSTGQIYDGSDPIESMPYAVAQDCAAYYSSSGVANVDLTGTPFKIADPFATGGFLSAGSATVSATGQVADLVGGGWCGFTTPEVTPSAGDALYSPQMAPSSGVFILDLAFAP